MKCLEARTSQIALNNKRKYHLGYQISTMKWLGEKILKRERKIYKKSSAIPSSTRSPSNPQNLQKDSMLSSKNSLRGEGQGRIGGI